MPRELSLNTLVTNVSKITSCSSFGSVSISQPIIGNNARFFQQLSLPLSLSFSALFSLSLSHPNGRLNVSHYSEAARNLTKAMRPHSFMGAHVFTMLFHLLLEEKNRSPLLHMAITYGHGVKKEGACRKWPNIHGKYETKKLPDCNIHLDIVWKSALFSLVFCIEKKVLNENILSWNEKVEVNYVWSFIDVKMLTNVVSSTKLLMSFKKSKFICCPIITS